MTLHDRQPLQPQLHGARRASRLGVALRCIQCLAQRCTQHLALGLMLILNAGALVDLSAATATPGGSVLAGVVLDDHLGGRHDLGQESCGHLLMLFTIAHRTAARRWDDCLAPYLDAGHTLIRVMDAPEIDASDRSELIARVTSATAGQSVRFLMDWTGAVRQRLGGSSSAVVITALSPTGSVLGQYAGPVSATAATRALAWVGVTPHPPIPDLPSHP